MTLRARRFAAAAPLALALLLPAAADAKLSPTGKVELISAGKGERKALRLAPKKGDKHTMTMRMGIEMSMAMGGRSMPPIKAPSTELVMTTHVTDVKAEEIRYEFVFTEVRVDAAPNTPPMQVEAMKKGLSAIKGASGWVRLDRRGRTLAADFTLKGQIDPGTQQLLDNLRQSLNQLSAPFPARPVGVGAKWRVVTRLDKMGFPLEQVATYELKRFSGGKGVAAVTLSQRTSASKVNLPNLPPGTTAELQKLNSSGTGDLAFDLKQVPPIRATTHLETDMQMAIEANGQRNVMGMQMKMDMGLTTKR